MKEEEEEKNIKETLEKENVIKKEWEKKMKVGG